MNLKRDKTTAFLGMAIVGCVAFGTQTMVVCHSTSTSSRENRFWGV